MRPLKVGVQLPEVEREVGWPEVRSMARAAEDVGFDSIWVGDHLLYQWPGRPSRGPLEAMAELAALAAVTNRVQIGPLVAATSFRSPALLAKQAATIDEVSGGRLILGLGAGWNEPEYRAFGFPFDRRVSRFEEAFTIIRTLLRDGRIDFDGQFYAARDCELLPRGPRPSGIPLLVGSEGQRMLAITLPHVEAWNAWHSWFGNTAEGLKPLLGKLDDACRAAGRDPATLLKTTTVFVQMRGGSGRIQGDDDDPPITPLHGSTEAVTGALRAYAELGIGHVQLVLDPITVESIEALGPALEMLDRG